MIYVFFATLLCAVTAFALRGAVSSGPRISLIGFDGVGVIVGFVAFVMAAAMLGPAFGFSLILSLLLHEFGHVMGYRMIGHDAARFRLVPVLSGVPISERPLANDSQAFLVAIMGPGVSVAPMALAFAISAMLAPTNPNEAAVFHTFAVTCGTLNFVNLLPFWPLDGGRCTRIFSRAIWPTMGTAVTVFMASMLASASLRTGSLALLVLAVIGAQSLFRKDKEKRSAMSPDQSLTAMATYAFVLAAHFCGGQWLLSQYF